MSELSFQCNFRSWELRALALPVEVRKPNLALVARTLSNQTVQVQPGTYYVTVKLPAGQEMLSRVIVGEHRETVAILEPQPEDASPNESLELQTYIASQSVISSSKAELIESLGAETITAKLRVFRGSILERSLSSIMPQKVLKTRQPLLPGIAAFSVDSASEIDVGSIALVQLLQAGVPPINIVLPISSRESCQLVLRRLPDGLLAIEPHFSNPEADALLKYYERGLLTQTATVTASGNYLWHDIDLLSVKRAEKMLFMKVENPIAAAFGAYTLLRLADIERLHNWTENLKNWFEWLPDGLSIRAEHLARLGEHVSALEILLDLPSRGMPIFSDGLSYAIDRLSLYITANRSAVTPQLIEQTQIQREQTLLKQLQQFAEYVDFRQPLLTFTGINPNTPDSKVLDEEDIEVVEGLNIDTNFIS